jgi:hypothetical protein
VPTFDVVPLAPSVEVVLAPVVPTELVPTLPELAELLPDPVFEDEPVFEEDEAPFALPVLLEAVFADAVLLEFEPDPLCDPELPVEPDDSDDDPPFCPALVSEEALLPFEVLKPADDEEPSLVPALELPDVSPPEAPVFFEALAELELESAVFASGFTREANSMPTATPTYNFLCRVGGGFFMRRRLFESCMVIPAYPFCGYALSVLQSRDCLKPAASHPASYRFRKIRVAR